MPSTRYLPPDLAVVVEFSGHLLPERVMLRGFVVTGRPASPWHHVQAAVVVAFPPAERGAVDYVLGLVRGTIPRQRRRQAARLPVSLVVRYRRAGERESRAGEVVDLATGGLALRVAAALPPAAEIVVELPLPGSQAPLELAGEEVYVAPQGDRVGVKFEWHGVSGVRRVRKVLRRLRGPRGEREALTGRGRSPSDR